MMPEMHRAKYNPNRMKANIQFRKAVRLARTNFYETSFASSGSILTERESKKVLKRTYDFANKWR